jgi:hypothetical protein
MDGLDDFSKECEQSFGQISKMMLGGLHAIATAHGSNWNISDDSTIDIPVNKKNAAEVYSWCKEIRSGYNVGLSKKVITAVKKARSEAHKFLYEEANDPATPIERKIELVKLTSKNKNTDLI